MENAAANCMLGCRPSVGSNRGPGKAEDKEAGPPVEEPASLGHHQLNARFSDGGTKTPSVSERGKKKGRRKETDRRVN